MAAPYAAPLFQQAWRQPLPLPCGEEPNSQGDTWAPRSAAAARARLVHDTTSGSACSFQALNTPTLIPVSVHLGCRLMGGACCAEPATTARHSGQQGADEHACVTRHHDGSTGHIMQASRQE